MSHIKPTNPDLYSRIATLITEGRKQVRSAVNSTLLITYWHIGRLIVEDEQEGAERAAYGKEALKELSNRLTAEFGKGFDITNLRKMRQLYSRFPIRDSVSLELSWTHYRHLLKVDDEQARQWYLEEAIKENWSTRALERQINSFYYQRLLASQNKTPVKQEAEDKTKKLKPHDVLKDPYVLEFLQLKNRPEYTESDLESSLLDELQAFLLELGSGFSFVASLTESRFSHPDINCFFQKSKNLKRC